MEEWLTQKEADDFEKNQYFLERDIEEDEFKIYYVTPEAFTWKEHPQNPFSLHDVIEWKLKAEKWDEIAPLLPRVVSHFINDFLKKTVDEISELGEKSEK